MLILVCTLQEISNRAERLACATGGRAGPPYGASPESVVKGPRVARSLDPLRTCFVMRPARPG